jgi:ppGpp synthetase/RelA/SpoT-type nucleotidyltranferase
VNKAGELLVKKSITYDEYVWAMEVVDNWRACHVYPINTFQSTLRARVKRISSDAIVAQRLKRIPSIILKLKRTKGMQLARMQDIGGLRAILNSIDMVYGLKEAYVKGFFEHELIRLYDYIDKPKISGYRGIHLIYKYKNENVKNFDGMLLELQIRTKLQHAWAMAVETIGTFLNQPLKSSLGKPEWLDYFKLVSAAFSTIENTNQVPTYENVESVEIYRDVEKQTHRLGILDKLMGFIIRWR